MNVVKHETMVSSENAMELFAPYDLIVDGSDNFPTRYLVNDACVLLGKPYVWGSIFRFDGQLSVFWAEHGPVLPVPVPRAAAAGDGSLVRRGRRPRDALRHDRIAADDRGREADHRASATR